MGPREYSSSTDGERSDEPTAGRMPIVAHETITGVPFRWRIIAAVDSSNVELR
jgi:hypothetical protein